MLTNFTRDGSKTEDTSETYRAFCERRYAELPDREKKRVENLHKFQVELLNHAATF
jgi:16S rRNA C967 or C1407 C5-methylase (RsmB/RsmF family)